MSEPADMVLPLLREMRAEIANRFDRVDVRFDTVDHRLAALEAAQASFKQALGAEALERRVRELEDH